MAAFVTWAATVVVVALLVAFAFHLVSLRQLPTTERPRTNVYDRQGRLLGRHENPEAAGVADDEADDATGSDQVGYNGAGATPTERSNSDGGNGDGDRSRL